MPRATVDLEGHRLELKTCPGGYVVIKQLPFGDVLKRRDRAMKYSQDIDGSKKADAATQININILNEASRRFDFQHCIIDHNLEDDNGNKLNFNNPATLDILDPRIAHEIELEIDKLNQDFDEEDFTMPSEATLKKAGDLSQPDEVLS